MQNNMVSIPSANINGSLKAANSSGNVVGVAGTVLTNAQRVYLTPASSYHLAAAARQTAVGTAVTGTSVGVVANAKMNNNLSSSGIGVGVGGIIGVSSSSMSNMSNISNISNISSGNSTTPATTSGAATTVRYFSQFSKQHLNAVGVGQRKLLNGDTMVLVNGSKPLIFATPNNNNINNNNNKMLTTTTAAGLTAATTVPNGNRVFINKPQQQQPQQHLQQQHIQQQQLQQQHLQQQYQQLHQQQHQQLLQLKTQQSATLIEHFVEEDVDELVEEDLQPEELKPEHVHDIKQPEQQLQEPLPLATGNPTAVKTSDPDAEPELDIVINNVVCSFSVRCHLKLREIALNGNNVEYRRENGMVTMKLRRPYTTASIWSSGRITCTGATSEVQAKIAARRYARVLAKLGFPTHFQNFRIVNVLGTCSMPWAIKIVNFSERHRDNASYEPELHPGVTYKMREPKATLKIFSTGSITVTAASVNDVESAIQHIYPLVHEFRKQRSAEELQHLRQKQRAQAGEDPNEPEEQVLTDAKVASKEDMFQNTTAAHTNATRPTTDVGASCLASSPITSMRRLDQFKQYSQLKDQTHGDRRHIPFGAGGEIVNQITKGNGSTTAASNSSSSTGDNICANARRRATECWATKLQNKRPRYNDPSTAANPTTGTIARTAGSLPAPGPGLGLGPATANVNFAPANAATAAALAASKLRNKPLIPVDVVLKQSSSRARNAAVAAANATITTATAVAVAAAAGNDVCSKPATFSPNDFHVDDLIEEDDDDDMDMHF